jgi:hypothetical protein
MPDTKLFGHVHSIHAFKNYFTAEIMADDGRAFIRLCDREDELVEGQRVKFSVVPKPQKPNPIVAGRSGATTPDLRDLSVREAVDIEIL